MPFDPRNNDPGGMGGYFVRQTGVSETPMIMPARDGYPTNSSSLGQAPIPPMPMLMGETTLGQQMGDNGTLYDIRYNLLNGANSRGVEGGYQWIPASAEQQVAARAAAMQDTYNQRVGNDSALIAAQQAAMDAQVAAMPPRPQLTILPITASIGAQVPPPPVAVAPPVSVGPLTDRTGYWGDSPYGNAIDSAGGAGVANPLLMRQGGMFPEEDGSYTPRMNAPVPVAVPAQVVMPAQPQPQPMPQPAMQARQFPFNQGDPALPPGFGANNGPTVIPNPATFGQDLRNRLRQQLPPVSRAQQLIDAQRKAMGR